MSHLRKLGRRGVLTVSAALESATFNRKVRRPTTHQQAVQVVAPAAHGSMGDEAMLVSMCELYQRAGVGMHLLAPGSESDWKQVKASQFTSIEDVSRLAGMRISSCHTGGRVVSFRHHVVLGADMMDGAYGAREISQRVGYLNAAARRGANAWLVNFSMRAAPDPGAVRLLQRLHPQVRLVARDRASQTRAISLLKRPIGVSPDVALHLRPSTATHLLPPRSAAPLIAVVVNGHLPNDAQHLSGYFLALVEGTKRLGVDVWVVAHDTRKMPGDPSLARHVGLAASVPSIVPATASDAKYVLSRADLVVTTRMHAAVSALSSGIPTVGLDYVDKFSGQFEWYGQEQRVVSSAPDKLDDALALVTTTLTQRGNLHTQLTNRAAELRSMPLRWITSAELRR